MAALANILDHPDALRRIARSARPGLALDFDGTISEIAPTSEAAVLHPRCGEALRRAVGKFAVVAVISGRSALDLVRKVDIPGVICVGNHGAERFVGGVYESSEDALVGADAVSRALARIKRATAQISGLVYEDKGFSASIHYRAAADPESARRELSRALATAVPNANRVESFWGKMILELRPSRAVNKGDALAELVDDYRLDALIFAGDDTTDIDAMRRLPALDCAAALSVAVISDDAPPALLESADYAANGVDEVADMLELLVRWAGIG